MTEPILTFENVSKSFKEICESAATDILNEGKPVDIFWSGGIDSTMTITSDSRIKENISNLAGGLDKINALRPVSFNYTDDYLSGNMQYTTAKDWWKDTTVGFVAQEVKTAIDNHSEIKEGFKMWQEYDNGTQSIAEGNVVNILVKAVQELSAEVEALKSKLEE